MEIQPPLQVASPDGDYKVVLNWTPVIIRSASNVTFSIAFEKTNGTALSNVTYDFEVKAQQEPIVQKRNISAYAISEQQLRLPNIGLQPLQVGIYVISINGMPVDHSQTSSFNLYMIPTDTEMRQCSSLGIVEDNCNIEHVAFFSSTNQPVFILKTQGGKVPLDVGVEPIWGSDGNVQFKINFSPLQQNNALTPSVHYDLKIFRDNGTAVSAEPVYDYVRTLMINCPPVGYFCSFAVAHNGTTIVPDVSSNLPLKLDAGNYRLRIEVYSVYANQSDDPNSPAVVEMPIQVTPEYPFAQASIGVLAVAFGAIVGLGRKTHSFR
ncbi:MAG: hypothetical protein ABI361_11140 [Nitrososphaera sp.]